MRHSRRLLTAAVVASLALTAAACGSDDGGSSDTATDGASQDGGSSDLAGTLNGAGASSQAAAMQGWVAGFQQANPQVTVNYDPVGSGGGRETFLSGGAMFAGSDAYMDDEELAAVRRPLCR